MDMKWALVQKKTFKVFDLPKDPQTNFLVGRHRSCALTLTSNKVSKEHGYLLKSQKGVVLISDMGTLNGTFVNKRKIAPLVLTELKERDEISFGLKTMDMADNEKDTLVFFVLACHNSEVESDLESGCTQVVNLDSAQLSDVPCTSGIATSTAIEENNDNMAATVRDMIQVSSSLSSLNAGSSRLAEHARDKDVKCRLNTEYLRRGDFVDLTTPSDDGRNSVFLEIKQENSDEEPSDNDLIASSSSKRIHTEENTQESSKRIRKSSHSSAAHTTYSSRKNSVEITAENSKKNRDKLNSSPITHHQSKSKTLTDQNTADKRKKSDKTEENQETEKSENVSSVPKRRHSKEDSHESSKRIRKTLNSSPASSTHSNRRHSGESTKEISKKTRESIDCHTKSKVLTERDETADKRSSLDKKKNKSHASDSKALTEKKNTKYKNTGLEEKQEEHNKTKDKQSKRMSPKDRQEMLGDEHSTQKKIDKDKEIGDEKKKKCPVSKSAEKEIEKKHSNHKKKPLDKDKKETMSKRQTTTKEKDKIDHEKLRQKSHDLNKNIVNKTHENKGSGKNASKKEIGRRESERNIENDKLKSTVKNSVIRQEGRDYNKKNSNEREGKTKNSEGDHQDDKIDDAGRDIKLEPAFYNITEGQEVEIVELSDDDDLFTNSQLINSTPVDLDQIKIEKEAIGVTRLDSVDLSDDDDLFTNSQLVMPMPTKVDQIKLEMEAMGLTKCTEAFIQEEESLHGFDNTQQIADVLEDGLETNNDSPPNIGPLPGVDPSPINDSLGEEDPLMQELSMIIRNAKGLATNDRDSVSSRKEMSAVPHGSISSLDKLTKEQIKEERRKKLKDLTQKPKKELFIQIKQKTIPKTLPSSKTNRGEFLLEEPKTTNKKSGPRCKSVAAESVEGISSKMVKEPKLQLMRRKSLSCISNSAPEREIIQSNYLLRSKTPIPAQGRLAKSPVAQPGISSDKTEHISRPSLWDSPRKNRSKSLCSITRSTLLVTPPDRSLIERGRGRYPSRWGDSEYRSRSKTPVSKSPVAPDDGSSNQRGRGRPPSSWGSRCRSRSKTPVSRSPVRLADESSSQRGRGRPPSHWDSRCRSRSKTPVSKSPVRPPDESSNQRGRGRPLSRYDDPDYPSRSKTPVSRVVAPDGTWIQRGRGRPPSHWSNYSRDPRESMASVETFTTPLANLNECFQIPPYNFRQRPNTPVRPHPDIRPVENVKGCLLQHENEDIMCSQSYDPSLMDGVGNNQVPQQEVGPAPPEIRRINIDDIMKLILAWEPKWLGDDDEFKGDPPLIPAAKKVPKTFESMREYEETFNPLLLREIWAHCYQQNKASDINPRAVHITHCRYFNGMVILDCLCYISDLENKLNVPCKFEDLILTEHVCKNENGAKVKSIRFAYITRVHRTKIAPNDNIVRKLATYSTSCDYGVEFTMILNHRPGREMAPVSYALIKPLMNIGVSVKMFKTIKNLRQSPLAAKILSPMISKFKVVPAEDELVCPLLGDALNPEQLQCVLEGASICTRRSPGIFCMQGPPGTGKSTVIINMVMQILFGSGGKQVEQNVPKEPKILLVAPSNTAVDNILMKLVEAKELLGPGFNKKEIKQIRIGREMAINRQVQKYSLENVAKSDLQQRDIVRNHPEYQKAYQNNTLSDLVKKVYGNRYDQEQRKVQDGFLAKSNVVCATLSSCVIQKITDLVCRGKLEFSCCIIDEATQCHEIESLLPTLLGIHKFVLVGDPKQLHATVLHKESKLMGFNQSLFARIEKKFSSDPRSPIRMLRTQYRMHEEICKFPNKMFYEGKLRSEPRVAHKIPANIRPYLVFNITSQSTNSTSSKDSYVNVEEVHLIKMMLTTLFEMVDLSHIYTVGIITPYNDQKNLICQSIGDYLRANPNIKVTVNTVDSFQGIEKDIVIISCVRHASNGFLQNVNRLNVALTRAKQALYIIGNYTLFKECKTLYDLREDAKRRKLLLDIKHDPTTINNFKKYIVR